MSAVLDSLRLYLSYVATSVRGQLQYRASTLMLIAGHLLTTGLEFVALWALFERFGQLRGWSLAEVALLYGMANCAFALAEAAGRGFKSFHLLVKSGDFDRLLLRPRSTVFQVAAQHFELQRIGRLLQGLLVLGYALHALDLLHPGPSLVLVLAAIAGGVCTFLGLFVLQATFTFWSTEGLEIFATVTHGGVETAQYPLSIYAEDFRRFFTYVIPLAFLNYVPGLAILGRPERFGPGWLAWASPGFGVVFLLVCLRVWRLGERRYRSTGS